MIAKLKEPPTQTDTGAKWQDADELRWAARHWAVQIGVKLPQVHVRPMTTQWASISTSGRLTLDADLLDVPKELGEFVIVHELVHMLAPNHGKLFKSFMYAYMPDWVEREQHLGLHMRDNAAKAKRPKGTN
jgi:predicted metal-dependent hydrolase